MSHIKSSRQATRIMKVNEDGSAVGVTKRGAGVSIPAEVIENASVDASIIGSCWVVQLIPDEDGTLKAIEILGAAEQSFTLEEIQQLKAIEVKPEKAKAAAPKAPTKAAPAPVAPAPTHISPAAKAVREYVGNMVERCMPRRNEIGFQLMTDGGLEAGTPEFNTALEAELEDARREINDSVHKHLIEMLKGDAGKLLADEVVKLVKGESKSAAEPVMELRLADKEDEQDAVAAAA